MARTYDFGALLPAAPDLDAVLHALIVQAREARHERTRLFEPLKDEPVYCYKAHPAYPAYKQEVDRVEALDARIARTPAKTREGVLAKLQLGLDIWGAGGPDDEVRQVPLSAMRDALAVGC